MAIINGTEAGETLVGTSSDDSIDGFSGNDTITGGGGNDTLRGGAGDDVFVYSAREFGSDTIEDFSAGDRLDLRGLNVADLATLSPYISEVSGGLRIRTEFGGGVESIFLRNLTLSQLTADRVILNTSSLGINVNPLLRSGDWFGGNGNDTVNGSSSSDTLNGGAGDDFLIGNAGNDVLRGGAGNDTLEGGGSSDNLVGGEGFDFATYTAALGDIRISMSNPSLNTREENGDTYVGIEGIIGSRFGDFLTGDTLANEIRAGDGNDILNGGSGADTLLGEAGNDLIFGDITDPPLTPTPIGVSSTGPSVQNLALGAAPTSEVTALNLTANFSLVANPDIQNSTQQLHTTVTALGNGPLHWYAVTVTASNVRFTIDIDGTTGGFDSSLRLIYADGGNFAPLAQNDDSPVTTGGTGSTSTLDSFMSHVVRSPGTYYVVVGDAFSNRVPNGVGYTMHISVADENTANYEPDGGIAGSDVLVGGAGNDTLIGGGGNDTLYGGAGVDNLNGGDGFDYASYQDATIGLTLFIGGGTVNTGEANGDVHISIEGLLGSQFSDIIGGDSGNNELHGLNGNDFLFGRDGIDRLIGGEGNDVLEGGRGVDRLEGGNGIDVASFRNSTTGVSAGLLSGGDTGEAFNDVYVDIENIWGSDQDDRLTGDNNGGQVYGFLGNDNLSGLGGDDFFYGGDGADTIDGGAGVDSSFFLAWQDQTNQFGTLERAEGGDTFTDFTSRTDRIILSRYWFGFGNIGGPAAALTETHANFVTNGAITTSRPSLIWNAGNRTLSFDADGAGATRSVLLGTFQASATLTLGDIWTA